MSCVWMLQRGHSGDGCVLASTLCRYDLRKGDLFVLSWARISQIQIFLSKVVGPGLVSTSPAFVSSSASHPAGPHGRHAQKR